MTAITEGTACRPKRPSLHRILTLRKQRRALARLTPEQLRDIGVSMEDAQVEAARRFWDLPNRFGPR